MKIIQNKNMKRNKILNNLKFLLPIVILNIISVLNIYGSFNMNYLYRGIYIKQIIFIIVGFVLMFLVYKINIKFFICNGYLFYVLGVVLLVLVLFIGNKINGATSWFNLGFISFQPSELFKFFYIIYLSYISCFKKKSIISLLVLIFIPFILIFLEPDSGVAFMYLLIGFTILLSLNKNKKFIYYIFIIFTILCSLFIYIYFYHKSLIPKSFYYRINRIMMFKDNSSYQLSNALVSIGSAGLFGHGLYTYKLYIPEATTDFIFDLSISNFGYIGGVIILLLYFYLIINIASIKVNNMFYKCILNSILYLFIFEVLEHILMNIGLAPITGITLPFLSYGGSSLISFYALFGLILKIYNKKDINISFSSSNCS
jgi:rod shape determining protein RodA